MENNEIEKKVQEQIVDASEKEVQPKLQPLKTKKTKIFILGFCLICIVAVVACLIGRGIKVKNHDEFVKRIQSVGYLTKLINDKAEMKDYEYLIDFENWSWHEDNEKILVYTLRHLEGDQTESIQFVFEGEKETLSRIWCNDMQLFVNFFLPAYKGQKMSEDELSRVIRKNLGFGVSVNGDDTFNVQNQGQYNNCIIEVGTYKVEYGEWFFGGEFSIEPAE